MAARSSISLPTPPRAFDASGLELVNPATPPRAKAHGDIRVSQVPVEPHLSVCSCSRDPGRTSVSNHTRNTRAAPAISTHEGSGNCTLSRLNHTASELAVYASQCRLPYPTQDSLPVAGQAFPDGIFTRKGSVERFLPQLLIDILLSRASWRNEIRWTSSPHHHHVNVNTT
jgi:hypothetical protein